MEHRILVPIDGSTESEAALEHALEHHLDATVVLLHAVDPTVAFAYGDDDYFDYEGYQQEAARQRERGEDLLAEYGKTAEERGADVETTLVTGRPARQILEAIEAEEIDHVVMGSRGRSGVGRVLFGSVAEAVTRRATVPVTIVR